MRHNLLFAVAIVERCVELDFFRQEASELYVGGNAELIEVVVAALAYALLQTSEAFGLEVALQIDGCHVGKFDVKVGFCPQAAFVRELLQAELVSPHFYVLHAA